MAVYHAATPEPIRPRRQIATAYFQVFLVVQDEVQPMRTQHKNAIATLRRRHPEGIAGHTHNHCALSQWRGVGCVKKRMLTHVRRKRRGRKASPRSSLLLEMQTVKALELLDEGLTLQRVL